MPYAYGAKIEHDFVTDYVNIRLTFRHPMDQDLKPPLALWLLEADDVSIDIIDSKWQDQFTLLLTSDTIAVYPERVLLEYNGPNSNLQTTWGKDWEPWGPILSTDIGKAPCFVDRGDPNFWDFQLGDFTTDWTWRELDLSGIVPAKATAVSIHLRIRAGEINKQVALARLGNTSMANVFNTTTLVANVGNLADGICPVNADRKIQYRIQPTTWLYIDFSVKGWWF